MLGKTKISLSNLDEEEAKELEDQSYLQRRTIWRKKFKSEARVMWVRLHASSLLFDSLTSFFVVVSYFPSFLGCS